jgi:hypothetical protein
MMINSLREPPIFSRRGWLIRFAVAAGAAAVGGCAMASSSNSLVSTVYARDARRVRALIASGANLEERGSDGSTPLLIAAETDQFEIAEALIDAGANIWATSEFGNSVGWAVEHSRVDRGAEARARTRAFAKLRNLGFTFPAAHSSVVLKEIRAGQWPPKRPQRQGT